MASDSDPHRPPSHVIADGWEEFAKVILPTVGGSEHADAHVAFRLVPCTSFS